MYILSKEASGGGGVTVTTLDNWESDTKCNDETYERRQTYALTKLELKNDFAPSVLSISIPVLGHTNLGHSNLELLNWLMERVASLILNLRNGTEDESATNRGHRGAHGDG